MKDYKELMTPALNEPTKFFLILQDERENKPSSERTEYQVTRIMYSYYIAKFIDCWGKRISFTSLDGEKANGFLYGLKGE